MYMLLAGRAGGWAAGRASGRAGGLQGGYAPEAAADMNTRPQMMFGAHPDAMRQILRDLVAGHGTVRNYLAPAHRTAMLVEVADALWGLTSSASPGSDTQFQLLKSFSSLSSTPAATSRTAR
jgi:hypothetical protein